MKKILGITSVLLCLLLATGCAALHESGIKKYVPKGYTESVGEIRKNEWNGYTDFFIYKYSSSEMFRNNEDYTSVSQDDIVKIKEYFADTEKWMNIENRAEEYTFDGDCISVGDYFRIETKEGEVIGKGPEKYGKYDDYSVYLFDTENRTLYYIHSNM